MRENLRPLIASDTFLIVSVKAGDLCEIVQSLSINGKRIKFASTLSNRNRR